MEDLFVEEHARGLGLGRSLLAALARVAQERHCRRIDLSVLEWNPAREFYHRINVTHMAAWLPYRMDHAAIAALATTSPEIGGA